MAENKETAIEILPGITSEEMRTMFFDGALVEPNYKLFQLNSKGHRYYYCFNEEGTAEFYPSVTTILSQTMPTPPHLIKWIASKGYEEAEAYKQERAYYGTFMHAQFEELIINRSYDLDALKGKLKDFMEVNKLPDSFIYYADELKKDVLAFAQFVIDYDVKPLAVEIALVHPVYKYAGMIDLSCTMLKKIGGEERINAIVDFKSGKNGFFEEYEIQLFLYAMMWNENFPDMKIDNVFNVAPKDWRKKPTYTLKDQSNSVNAQQIPHLLALASIENSKRENIFTSVSGAIMLDVESVDLNNNITSLTLAELVGQKKDVDTPSENVAEAIEAEKPKHGRKKKAESAEEKPKRGRKKAEKEPKTAKKTATSARKGKGGVTASKRKTKRIESEND